MKSDHDDKDINSGYISFDLEKTGQRLKALIEIAESLEFTSIELGECCFRDSVSLRFQSEDENDLNKLWKIFYDDIVKMIYD